MPKGSQQTRADIITQLKENRRSARRTDLITQEELELAMSKCGISAPGPVRDYIKNLIAGDYIERTGGGYKLTQASRSKQTIRILVSPTQNYGEIVRAIGIATQRFGKTVTMEIEP